MRLWFAVVPFLIAAESVAQTEARSLLPKDSTFVVEFDGLPTLVEKFAGTNLGAMCQTEEWDNLWQEAMDAFDAALADETPMEEAGVRAREILETYSGRVYIGIRLELFDGERVGQFAVVLGSDGETDFQELVDLASESIADQEDMQVMTAESPAGELDVARLDDKGATMLLPTVVEGHLVFALGHLDDYLATLGEREAVRDANTDALHVRVDEGFWRLLPELLEASGEFESSNRAIADVVVNELVGGLGPMSFGVRPRGRFIEAEYSVGRQPDQPSIFDLFDVDAKPAEMLAFAPRLRPSATTFGFNFEAMLELVGRIATTQGEDLAEGEAMFEAMSGLRLREDLLDHFDGSMMMVNELGEEPEDINVAITFGMKNAEALETVIEQVIRQRGLHAGRKTKDYRGRSVRSLNFGFFALDWVFTETHLTLGFGADGGGVLRKIIDGIEDRKNGDEPVEWSDGVRARLAHVGQDYDWLQVADGTDSQMMLGAIETAMADTVAPAASLSMVTEFFRILGDHEMFTSVSSGTFAADHATFRTIW